nr:N-acetylmuramidase/lysin [uncultured Mediterranean phage uvMED]
MFALVEDNKIVSMPKGNKGITIDGVQHPSSIFTLWTDAERLAIGIYPVRIDTTNKKDEAWYINTNITYAVDGNEVVGTYGTATAKSIDDSLWTQQDSDDGDLPSDKSVGDVKVRGLKYLKKEMLDQQCAGILAPSDWRVIKAKETSTTMNSGWKTWRASVRTKCNSMQDQIDAVSNVDELAALFSYTTTDGVTSRPLGEFPTKDD